MTSPALAAAIARAPRGLIQRACRMVLLCLFVLVAFSGVSNAQAVLGEGTPGTDSQTSHAWLILRQEADGECFLVHLPPRESIRADGQVHGAPSGTVRVAARMKSVPVGLAAVGAEAFLLFDPAKGGASREVWSLAARPSGLGDLWRYEPDTRLNPRPSLPPDFVPEAFFGASGRVFTMGIGPGTDASLRVLDADRWLSVDLPEDVAAALRLPERRTLTYETPGGFVVGIGNGDAALAWSALVRAQRDGTPTITWSSLPAGTAHLAEFGGQLICGTTLIRWIREESTIRAMTSSGGQFLPLADVAGVTENSTLVSGGAARLIVAWSEELPADPRVREPKKRHKLMLTEISANTGQVLYSGPPKGASPISTDQFRFLVLGMVALMAAVLIFVLRSSGREETVHLDPDMGLAEPGRRALAFAIDLAAAGTIAARILGVEIPDLFSPTALLGAGGPWVVLTLGVGLILSVACEWGFGRTPGKFLTATEVVGLVRTPGASHATSRPNLWQVLARNLIKWGLPPVSGIALLDPSSRHQGERITRTAVIVRYEPADDEAP